MTDKKERQRNQQKEWREKNRDKVKQQMRQYTERRRMGILGEVIEKPTNDKLIENLDIPLNPDQTLYLLGHRHEKRTILAKKIGIMKLQLCYKLEKLERTGSL